MGSNAEIRQRMDFYRGVLLVVVWIGAVAGIIGGITMIIYDSGGWYSYPLRPYGIALLIASIFGGIIGHFLVNVGLAVPFILLNNGDILESMKKNVASNAMSTIANTSGEEMSNKDDQNNMLNSENKRKIETKYATLYVANKSTLLKYGSSLETDTIKTIFSGTKVKFISANNPGWYCIETLEGDRGFCLSSDLIESD
jgi:hypothetical protein